MDRSSLRHEVVCLQPLEAGGAPQNRLRRRLNAALHLFGGRPGLNLMYAALVRAAEGWRGLTITDFETKQLHRLQEELRAQHRPQNMPVTQPASTLNSVYSKDRT